MMVRTLTLCAVALSLATGCMDWDGQLDKVDESSPDGGPPTGGRKPSKPPRTDTTIDPISDADGGTMMAEGDAGIMNTEPDDPIMLACQDDADCGDLERFYCDANQCLEHECHAARACSEPLATCQSHACIPFIPPERFPTGYSQTSGGGSVASGKYKLRFSTGMPQPFGKAASSKYQIVLGPGAGRP